MLKSVTLPSMVVKTGFLKKLEIFNSHIGVSVCLGRYKTSALIKPHKKPKWKVNEKGQKQKNVL